MGRTIPDDSLLRSEPDKQTDSPLWPAESASEAYEPGASRLSPGTTSRISLLDQGSTRDYEVYVPKFYNGQTPLPVMMLVHGTAMGSGSGTISEQSGMNALADKEGFLAVYPLANQRPAYGGLFKISSWNTSGSNIMERDGHYDDISYIDHVLDDVGQKLNVDSSRVSALGYSAGAVLIQKYQLERPGRLAAIASVSGTVLPDEKTEQTNLEEKTGLPILIIHGDSDHVLPYAGGSGLVSALGHGVFDGVNNSRPYLQKDLWKFINNCRKAPTVTYSNNIQVSKFDKCEDGPVREYLIRDSGHTYPPRLNYSRHTSVDTSELVASFLLAHKLRAQEDADDTD